MCLNTSYRDERIRILRVFSFYRNADRRACARRISTCRPRVAVLVSLHVRAFHHYINCRHISKGIHSAAPLISTAHPRLYLFLPWSLSTVFLDPTIPWMSYYLLYRGRTIIRRVASLSSYASKDMNERLGRRKRFNDREM